MKFHCHNNVGFSRCVFFRKTKIRLRRYISAKHTKIAETRVYLPLQFTKKSSKSFKNRVYLPTFTIHQKIVKIVKIVYTYLPLQFTQNSSKSLKNRVYLYKKCYFLPKIAFFSFKKCIFSQIQKPPF